MRNRRARPIFWLVLLAILSHSPALMGAFGGALPSTGDTLGAFAPWHEFARRNLIQHGAMPLWNPHLYGGVPFLSNGQSALFYPPTYLHFLLPEGIALWLFACGHSAFLMVGGYFLGRTLGLSRRAAFLLGALFGLGNATPAHLFGGHLTFLPARSFWPWQAAFLIRLLRTHDPKTGAQNAKTGAQNAICWAACIALGLAAGAPQIWLFGVLFNLAIGAFWAFEATRNRVFWRTLPWKSGALALILAALWCAPTLLPLRELRSWSSHGDLLSFAEVTDLSATPRSLFRLLFNGFFGGNSFQMWSLPSNPGEDAASIGLAGAIFALAALFLRRTRIVTALLLGSALCLILALGDATPLYRVFYNHIAIFQITRVPARWLELWAFGAAILAAFGFEACLQNPQRAQKMTGVWLASALGCLALLFGVLFNQTLWPFGAKIVARALSLSSAQIPALSDYLRGEALLCVVIATSVMGLLAWLWRRGLRPGRAANLLLALCVAEPLLSFWLGVRIAPSERVSSGKIGGSIVQQHRNGQRWIVQAPFQQLNAPLWNQIDAINGYEPFGSAPFFDFARATGARTRFAADFQPQKMAPLWRVMGASHLLWKPKSKGESRPDFPGPIVAQEGEWQLVAIEDGLKPWPRAYLTRGIARADKTQALRSLRNLAAKPWKNAPPAVVSTAVVSPTVAPLEFELMPQAPMLARETVREIYASPDAKTWEISPARASLFVQNETMAPGWKAFVDAKPAEMLAANAIFRGVAVPANAKEIAMVYDSQTLRFALFLAFLALAAAGAMLPQIYRARSLRDE